MKVILRGTGVRPRRQATQWICVICTTS